MMKRRMPINHTKPELILRKALKRRGIGYRLHVGSLAGSPDIVLHRYGTVIFVNGCFWHHHHNCERAVIPRANREFWLKKFEDGKRRDQMINYRLNSQGWRTIVVWECELEKDKFTKTVERVLDQLIEPDS